MAINLTQIRDLLLPGLMGFTGKYDMIPRQWDKVFTTVTSKMAQERNVEMALFGTARLKTEGAATEFDNEAGQRYVYNQEHMEVGLGFAITRRAIDDNQYRSQFGPSAEALNDSFAQTKEIYGAAIFNAATTYDPKIGGDGKALCAVDHPIDGSVQSNRPAIDVDLGEATLLNGMASVRGFRNARGLKIMTRARKLVVPPNLEPIAIRLLQTELRPGTADNDVNALKSAHGGLPDGYVTLDFLTSPYAWFLLTNVKGLLHMKRIKYETKMTTDFVTDNLLTTGYERYSFGFKDWRSIYGSFPTS